MLLHGEIINNTQNFLRRLSPTAFDIAEPPAYSPGLKMMQHTRLEPRKAVSIIGLDRIAFCSIRFNKESGMIHANLDMDYSPGTFFTPCYWLPWMKDGIVRIKLKPSRLLVNGKAPEINPYGRKMDTVKGGQTMKNAGVQVGDPNGDFEWKPRIGNPYDRDVRLFFTGMMDGCSTWAAGDPREPDVYHVNRATAVQQSGLVEKDEGKAQKFALKEMTADFVELHKSQHAGTKPVLKSSNPVNMKLVADSRAEKIVDMQSEVVRRLIKGPVGNRYKVIKQYYTAFGVKDSSGIWNFYRQGIYQYRSLEKKTFGGNGDFVTRWDAVGSVLTAGTAAEQFFP